MDKKKTPELALLHRVYRHRGNENLSLTVMAGFSLADPSLLFSEDELWIRAGQGLPAGQALDQGMPKPTGEVLVAGIAHAPQGQAVPGLEVGIGCGSVKKRLFVFGERHWTNDGFSKSDPEPFKKMDLTWDRAFGGKEFDRNPLGRGLNPIQTPQGERWPLPNIEDPEHLIASPGDRPPSAGLGPLGPDWPVRLTGLGTYDDEWLANDWPGLPPDFDHRYFNVAPPDQQLPVFFKGGEPVEAIHLAPDQPHISSTLPQLRARAFIRRQVKPEKFSEMPLNLDTVWLMPHLDLGILIWHGTAVVEDDEAEDVDLLAVFLESGLDAPKPLDFYQGQCPRSPEAEPEDLVLSSSVPLEAAAPAPETAFEESVTESLSVAKETAFEESDTESLSVAEETAPASVSPDSPVQVQSNPPASAPEGPFTEPGGLDPYDGLPTELREILPRISEPPSDTDPVALMDHFQAQIQTAEESLNEYFRIAGVDPSEPPIQASDSLDPYEGLPSELLNSMPRNSEPPSDANPAALLDHYRTQIQAAEEKLNGYFKIAGVDPSQSSAETLDEVDPHEGLPGELLDSLPPNPEPPAPGTDLRTVLKHYHALARTTETNLNDYFKKAGVSPEEMPLGSARVLDDYPPISELDSAADPDSDQGPGSDIGLYPEPDITEFQEAAQPLTREDVLQAKAEGRSLAGENLAGLDLSGADLSGMDFSGANLEGAVLSQTNLTQSNLKGSIFTGSDMTDAVLASADLERANLSQAQMGSADLNGALLMDADLTRADLTRATLSGADLSSANLTGASLVDSRADGLRAPQADFSEADLTRADFSSARLKASGLNDTTLDQVNFSKADLSHSWLSGARGEGVHFEAANLYNLRSSDGTCLPDLKAKGADLTKAYLEHSDFSRADFSTCTLNQTSFIQCRLEGANLSRAEAKEADFSRSNLGGSQMTNMNLFHGSLRKARLSNADLRDSNLFGADLYKSVHGQTKLDGANLERTLLTVWEKE